MSSPYCTTIIALITLASLVPLAISIAELFVAEHYITWTTPRMTTLLKRITSRTRHDVHLPPHLTPRTLRAVPSSYTLHAARRAPIVRHTVRPTPTRPLRAAQNRH